MGDDFDLAGGHVGFSRPSPRRRTLPLTATTYSERAASAFWCAGAEISLSRTIWVMPVRSRRSRKMRLPWSRRRLTQPIRTTSWPSVRAKLATHMGALQSS